MRTNIVIDDQLMRDATQASGAHTKREAVDIGLRTLVKLEQQKRIKALRGHTLVAIGDLILVEVLQSFHRDQAAS
ncbi:MAG: type II toxin-antitoxin system VapB family antitoxin [Cyanobacteria bacterium K_DeepCast_35m_m2_023]|nr:type II toxin-antitoxin system VapB family antitoxin [Cyanobacteria bacterium K_DeepCast_35m_m2_023]